MVRQQFLKTIGISFTTVCVGACLSACRKPDEVKPIDTVTSLLDTGLASVNFTDLVIVGSSKIVNGILFSRIAYDNSASSFIAIHPKCPHQQGPLAWNKTNNTIECGLHGATYTPSGAIILQPQRGGGTTLPLKTYKVSVNATAVIAKAI